MNQNLAVAQEVAEVVCLSVFVVLILNPSSLRDKVSWGKKLNPRLLSVAVPWMCVYVFLMSRLALSKEASCLYSASEC